MAASDSGGFDMQFLLGELIDVQRSCCPLTEA
jgi:hypothetical protein